MIIELPPFLARLDNTQRAAALDIEGNVVIIAGAGSGKSATLTSRAAYLLSKGISPEEILCLTFTNKAADEMKGRIESYSGRDISEMWIGTYHAICAKILRSYGTRIGIPQDYAIYEPTETRAVLRKVCSQRRANMQTEIDRHKAQPDGFKEWHRDLSGEDFARIFNAYQSAMKSENALDFSDLTREALRLLQTDKVALQELSARFRYVLVDEYQDSTPVEAELIRLLSSHHGNLCVVGDPRQSIFGWRGSDPRLILDFEKTNTSAKKHTLDINYRSVAEIVNHAERVAASLQDVPVYRCRAFRSDKGLVNIRRYESESEEVAGITASISGAIKIDGIEPRDLAVLCRTNKLVGLLHANLCRNNIPCAPLNGSGLFDRNEVRCAIAFLRSIQGGDVQVGISTLRSMAACGMSLTGILDEINARVLSMLDLRLTAAEIAYRNLESLKSIAHEYPGPALNTITAFLDSCEEACADSINAVQVITIHQSKGLEFPVVFVPGFGRRFVSDEEQRLMYVALTRATDVLFDSLASG